MLKEPNIAVDVLAGGGETGAMMRAMDWASSPLGLPDLWPQSLKTAVRIVLTSRQPMFVWWGPELINLYNDPYRAIVGGKHPEALGQPAAVVWREIWDQIGPRAEQAMRLNEGTYDEALRLVMERNGYPEETYYTFSYSPVPNDEGGPGGIICANTDDTQRIIGARQLVLLRELATGMAEARTIADACECAARALATNPQDLPFALIYLFDGDGQVARLAGSVGVSPSAAPEVIGPGDARWPFAEVIRTLRPALIANPGRAFPGLPKQPENAELRAIALPIAPQGQTGRAGILVAGLNPYRLLDDLYQGFLDLVAGQIASGIATADAYEEERRRAEALAEIDRAKTTFFSNVSHEFRTPLTLMLSPLEEVLAQDDVAPPARALLDVAHRNSLRLLKLVNALLDFSRIEAGRTTARYEPVDLAALTAELASNFRSATERAGLALKVACPRLPQPVHVDREMWEKIVLNLLSNAFKFTFEGGIAVTLRAEGDCVLLRVADSGVGVPAHELPHLFERFHRVEGQRSRSFEGSGIGLALVHELVRLHGGSIDVESRVGAGTTFSVAIPLGIAHLPPQQIAEPGSPISPVMRVEAYVEEALHWLPDTNGAFPIPMPPPQAAEGPRPFIMIAEDNADMRHYLRRLLEDRYEVETVADGNAALAAVGRRRPDLLLSDVMMPGLDGFGLLRRLRDDPATRDLSVILLSARAGEEARSEGLDAGADDYLTKPFSAREMLAQIGANLAMARVRREAAEALRGRSAELETVLATVPAGVWFTHDRRGRDIQCNSQAMQMLRLQPGQNASLSAPEGERPSHYRMFRDGREAAPETLPIQRAARGETVSSEELEARFDDGTSLVMLLHATSLPDGGGAVAAALDITARKQDERRIARFKAFSDHSNEAHYVLDSDGRLIYANPAAARRLGYCPQELLSLGIADFDPLWSVERFRKLVADIPPDPLPPFESLHRRKDGSIFPVEMTISIIFDEGKPFLSAIARDITARKAAEAELRELNDKLAIEVAERTRERDMAWRASRDLLVLCDFDGYYRKVSQAWTDQLGYLREELIGAR